MHSKLLTCLCTAAVLLLAACGPEKPEVLLASAKSYLAKNDYKAAVIQAKAALQGNAELAEARFVLGSALLEATNPVSAELELRKALALKYDEDRVVPKLAAAMLQKGDSQKLVDEFGSTALSTDTAIADLQTTLAAAYSVLGNATAADAALDKALAADAGFAPARLEQARRKAAAKQFDAALQVADAVLSASPASHQAWQLKGDVLLVGKNQPVQAMQAYREAAKLRPDFLPAQLRIAAILMRDNDRAGLEQQVATIAKIAPNHPDTRYLQVQLALTQKDLKTAREASQQLLKLAPESPKALEIAGYVELQLNALLQAEALLKKALQAAPELGVARKALIQTYLRSGQAAQAMSVLNGTAGEAGIGPDLYALAGEVYLHAGNPKKAQEFLQKSLKLDPKDPARRTSLAVANFASGQSAVALEQLQDIAGSDAGINADLALISAYLGRKEFDKALAAIAALQKKQPDKPLPLMLRGKAYAAQGKRDEAQASFEAALKLDPTHFAALAGLTELDVAAGRPDAARKRLEAVLAKNPRDARVLMGLAELARAGGAKPAEVAELINKAVSARPDEAGPRLLLIDHYLRAKDAKQAVQAATSANAALPDNLELLDALGRSQAAAGDYNQALATFSKLAALRPNSPQPHLRMADVNIAARQPEAALDNFRKSLDIVPDLLQAQRGMLALHVAAKRDDQALAVAKTVQRQRPTEGIGHELEADVHASRKRWDAAIAEYRLALKLTPTSELASRLHVALTAAGKAGDADVFAAGWMKEHPKDQAFKTRLGELAIAKKDYAAAEKIYLGLIQDNPDQAPLLNNLAWVSGMLNRPDAANYSEKANALKPDQPEFLDTWAMLLSEKNQAGKAIELQNRAVQLRPDDPYLRLNLAKIYIKSGDRSQANQQLERLAKLGDRFSGQNEVAALLKAK